MFFMECPVRDTLTITSAFHEHHLCILHSLFFWDHNLNGKHLETYSELENLVILDAATSQHSLAQKMQHERLGFYGV